ncbi:DoxX family protein [Rhizobium sp. CG4]|uniref:DoxX family protein n=1 Tax=Rhizobium sp. CG4 TaxID=2726075 RepID=UPI0020347AD8|nr:DoxX family protein [Rhizobium sp. CG4]MCM2458206.1 DoxX family protein [Rhizobium sp. CG4]
MSTTQTTSHSEKIKSYDKSYAISALVGRFLLSPIFVLSGIGKVTSHETYLSYIAAFGMPFPVIWLIGAIAIELGGGLALAIGFKTRTAALILALFSLFTALVFHNDFSDQNQFLHFWKNIAIAGGLLQATAFGAGIFSLDGFSTRRR